MDVTGRGGLPLLPSRYTQGIRKVGVSAAWSVLLWVGAGGFVMPVWLNLVGMETPVPTLGLHDLAAHLSWGLTLGAGDVVSRNWGVPNWVDATWERWQDRDLQGPFVEEQRATPAADSSLHLPEEGHDA